MLSELNRVHAHVLVLYSPRTLRSLVITTRVGPGCHWSCTVPASAGCFPPPRNPPTWSLFSQGGGVGLVVVGPIGQGVNHVVAAEHIVGFIHVKVNDDHAVVLIGNKCRDLHVKENW